MNLNFFASISDAAAYMAEELLRTLEEDLRRMEKEEFSFYTNADREEMRARITDLEAVAPVLAAAFASPSHAVRMADAIRFAEHVASLKKWGEQDDEGEPFEPADGTDDSHDCLMDLIDQAREVIADRELPPAKNRPFYTPSEGETGYVVEYELPYTHRVQVGVYATDSKSAAKKVGEAFDAGAIWDDTPEMPLLYDEFEEDGDAGVALTFAVVAKGAFPAPDASVKNQARDQRARKVLSALEQGEITEALRLAKEG